MQGSVPGKGFRCTDVHHDGCSRILCRKYEETAAEDETEHLRDRICYEKVTREDIDAVTDPPGETVMMTGCISVMSRLCSDADKYY